MIGAALEPRLNVTYPGGPIVQQGSTFADVWQREALTPTGFWTLYTDAAGTGAGSGAMRSDRFGYRLTTGASIGDDYTLRTSGYNFRRDPGGNTVSLRPNITQLHLQMSFNLTSSADTEGFVGILNGQAALTAIPTTARHVGVFWDASAGANFTLSSADGTTQSTTDSTVALSTSGFIVDISITGENAATVRLLNASTGAVSGATQTVTALGNLIGELTWFVQTEAASAKSLDANVWYGRWA